MQTEASPFHTTNLLNTTPTYKPHTFILSQTTYYHNIHHISPYKLHKTFKSWASTQKHLPCSPNHCLISVSCPLTPVPPQDSPKWRCFWHYVSAKLDDLRMCYSKFPWYDYCFCVKRSISLCWTHNRDDCLGHGSVHPTLSLTPKLTNLGSL